MDGNDPIVSAIFLLLFLNFLAEKKQFQKFIMNKAIYDNGIHITEGFVSLFFHLFVCLFGFYGMSTFVGYLLPNPI